MPVSPFALAHVVKVRVYFIFGLFCHFHCEGSVVFLSH